MDLKRLKIKKERKTKKKIRAHERNPKTGSYGQREADEERRSEESNRGRDDVVFVLEED